MRARIALHVQEMRRDQIVNRDQSRREINHQQVGIGYIMVILATAYMRGLLSSKMRMRSSSSGKEEIDWASSIMHMDAEMTLFKNRREEWMRLSKLAH